MLAQALNDRLCHKLRQRNEPLYEQQLVSVLTPKVIDFSFSSEGEPSAKLMSKTDTSKIMREIQEGCCKKNCIQSIPIRAIKEARECYWRKNVTERRDVLSRALANGLVCCGEFVCAGAWCKVHGISIARSFT